MLKKILKTERDWTVTIVRITLGLVIFPHGAQKALGWFGGFGMEGTLGFFSSIGIPTVAGVLVIAAEFLGGLGLITGALSRVAAVGIAAVMAGAMVLGGHLQNGFFLNWTGGQGGEGVEFHLLLIAMALVVVIRGGGAFSIDGLPELRRRHPPIS